MLERDTYFFSLLSIIVGAVLPNAKTRPGLCTYHASLDSSPLARFC